jgi:predicted PurR-regulated permease PerM
VEEMKKKLVIIAVVLGLAVVALTGLARVEYSKDIQDSLYSTYTIDLFTQNTSIPISGLPGFPGESTYTQTGLLFSYMQMNVTNSEETTSTKYIFSPIAFMVDFLIFFAIFFVALFFFDRSVEKRKRAYEVRMQQLHYMRRKIRRR